MARAQPLPRAVDLLPVCFDPDWLVRELVRELVGHLGELVGGLVAVAFGPAARAWLQVAADLVIARCRRTIADLRDDAGA